MLKLSGKRSPIIGRTRFRPPQHLGYKIAFIILPALLVTACGKFFPDAGTLVAISISPTNPSIQSGATQQFTATGTFGNSSQQNVTSSVIWTSSSTSIATINSSGLATAGTTFGPTTITASESGVSAVTTLTVSSQSTAITIACSGCTAVTTTTASASLSLSGGSVTFSATSNGSAISPTWTSSNTGVANFLNSASGTATLTSIGTTTITANANGTSSSLTLTVTQ